MRWLRVAAHVHSLWSYDAHRPLPRIAATFRRLGYDAVLLCEHDRGFTEERWRRYQRACDAASDRILLVPGVEHSDPDDVVHIPVWGGATAFLGASRPTADLLHTAAESGSVAVLAHPGRRDAWSRLEGSWMAQLTGVEVWNRKYDGVAPNAAAASLAQQHGLCPFVSLDYHTPRQLFPLAMEVPVDGPVTADALLSSLAASRGRPTALGRPAARFSGGRLATLVRGGERARRRVAPVLRRVG